MARTGGTVIGKCLASMDSIMFFSEIHPQIINEMSIIEQAYNWFDLLGPVDMKRLFNMKSVGFNDSLDMIFQKCKEQKKSLVIRDWSHIDFTKTTYKEKPSFKLTTSNYIAQRFPVIRTAIVRHPIDQWLSLRELRIIQLDPISPRSFLYGYSRFAEYCNQIGFIRYEDFIKNPNNTLKSLCQRLELVFDPCYNYRWYEYSKITGDIHGAGRGGDEIKPLPRRPIKSEQLLAFEKNPDYIYSLELLGYSL